MTSFQKVIKYGAIAFAVYLCFVIIGIIVGTITTIFGISTGMQIFEDSTNEAMITKWEQEYSNITNLDIDLSVCKLVIKKGDTLKVEASEIFDQFKCSANGNKLKIEDKTFHRNFFNEIEDVKSEVVIYVPDSLKFDEVTIETGVNETNIEYLKANKVNMEMGVGRYQVKSILAKHVKIEAGAGEANIEDGNMEDLKLDGGIGKLSFTGKITKTADIESGVGRLDVNLIGSLADYKVKAEKGLGNFRVNGEKVSDQQTIGNGDVSVKVNAGVGETVVNFKER